MSDKTNEARVKEIIVEQLGVNEDQVTPEAKLLEDLGADSLDAVELVMAIEEEFGIEVPDDEAEGLISLGHIVRVVPHEKQHTRGAIPKPLAEATDPPRQPRRSSSR